MSINPGTVYQFKIEARNVVGYGPFSDEVSIIASTKPNKPSTPSTSPALAEIDVLINWDPLADFVTEIGSPITSYRIMIQHADGVSFSEELTNCDGSDPTIVENTECTVPISVLLLAPYNMID